MQVAKSFVGHVKYMITMNIFSLEGFGIYSTSGGYHQVLHIALLREYWLSLDLNKMSVFIVNIIKQLFVVN